MEMLRNIEIHPNILENRDSLRVYTFHEWPYWESKNYGQICYNVKDKNGYGSFLNHSITFICIENGYRINSNQFRTIYLSKQSDISWVLKFDEETIEFIYKDYRKHEALAVLNGGAKYTVKLFTCVPLLSIISNVFALISFNKILRSRNFCLIPKEWPKNERLETILILGLTIFRLVHSNIDFDSSFS